jgi:Na+-transporting methylmalonyl-CoA/oxaloacetate decarboxylase gamma subunit
MFSSEFFELLKQILVSWQVIVVTVGLVIYIYIVNYVSRSYRRTRVKKEKVKKPKKAEPVIEQEGVEEVESGSSSNDELGLEES